jgi:flagellin-like protein
MHKKGITPIIATVFLVAMTIAAAGATYIWISSIIGPATSKNPLAAKIELKYSKCHAGSNQLEVALLNTGTAPIDVDPTNIFVWDLNTGQLLEAMTRTGITGSSLPPKLLALGPVGGFTGNFNFTLGANFGAGKYYKIQIDFPDMKQNAPLISLSEFGVNFVCSAD